MQKIWNSLVQPSPGIIAEDRRLAKFLSALLLVLILVISILVALPAVGIEVVEFGSPINKVLLIAVFCVAYAFSRTRLYTTAVLLFLVGFVLEIIYLTFFATDHIQTIYLYYLIWPIITSSFFYSNAAPGLVTIISLIITLFVLPVDREISFVQILTGPLGVIGTISGLGASLAYFRSQKENEIQKDQIQKQTARLAEERNLLRMTSLIAKKLLETPTWMGRSAEVLEILAKETETDRVTIFKNELVGRKFTSHHAASWHGPGIEARVDYQQLESNLWSDHEINKLMQRFCSQDVVILQKSNCLPEQAVLFEGNNVETILCIPISSGSGWWGWMAFETYTNRRYWSEVEVDALKLAANILSSVIERQEAEQALRESEERFRSVAKSAKDAIISIDSQMRIIFWNDGAEQMFGYTSREILAQKIDLITPDHLKPFHTLGMKKVLSSGTIQYPTTPVESVGLRKDGSLCPVELSFGSWSTGQGTFFTAIIRDVTERKMTEEALRRAYNENQQLLASISSILIGITPDGRITHWNSYAVEMFDIPAEAAVHQKLSDLKIEWDLEKIQDAIRICAFSNKKVRAAETTYVRPDGHALVLGISVHPILEDDKQVGYLLLGSDITQNKIVEQQLAQSHKLDSIGQLASGIAHEINTPAQFVTSNLRFLGDQWPIIEAHLGCSKPATNPLLPRRKPDTGSPSIEYLTKEYPRAIEQSLVGIERIARIVGAMRIFSHPAMEKKSSANVNRLIDNSLILSRNAWRQVAEITTDLAGDLPEVICHPAELSQAFLNIVINAADAIAEKVKSDPAVKGLISVRTRCLDEAVEVRITDNGAGIPSKIQNRIFDYFFTTKDVNQGTGQGLAIVYNTIVKKHSGSIRFETKEGAGTTFIILIPIEEPKLPDLGEQHG